MDELDLIHGRFNQTFWLEHEFGNSATHRAWHGPSLLRALEGIDAEQAMRRPVEGRHSIWEIVNHCTYWMDEVDRALQGEKIFDVKEIEDWTRGGESSAEWAADLEKLKEIHATVDKRIRGLKQGDLERKLEATFGETFFGFTFRKMLHGISDHNLYHAGQVSLLKSK